MVFADKYLNYRYKLGRDEGREEGCEEGHREGREKGREEGALAEHARWMQYLRDVEVARKTGTPEPAPPSAEVNGSVNR